jgi:hypothetical protein
MSIGASADASAGASGGCEDLDADGVPPAPADFQGGLGPYSGPYPGPYPGLYPGMEAIASLGELEALSADTGFMDLPGMPPAMPDYSDLEYAAYRMQARAAAVYPRAGKSNCKGRRHLS